MSELQKCYKALDALASTSTIRKSIDSSLSPKKQRAVAIAKATKTPAGAALARRILQLEKQQAVSFAYAVPVVKAMGGFSHENGPLEAHTDDELLEKLEEITRELKRRGFVEEEA